VLVAAAILTAAGCYETDFEIIDASSAVAVNGVSGTYTKQAGGTMTISAVPHSNDYRFREVSKDNKGSTGYLRMVPLQGDIYIVQVKYDNEPVYYLVFYKFTYDSSGARYWEMYPDVSDEKLNQLAQQHGVAIDWDTSELFIPILNGSRSNIMAFLRAHAGLPFAYSE
jgi:hypothetical protein